MSDRAMEAYLIRTYLKDGMESDALQKDGVPDTDAAQDCTGCSLAPMKRCH